MAAYEAKFARIGDLGGGVLPGLIGSPGLPEICPYPHSGACQGVLAVFLVVFIDCFRGICVLEVYERQDALGAAPALLGLD